MMKKIFRIVEVIQETLTPVFLIIMALSSLLQVINRTIFKIPIPWTEELSRYCMIWMAMIGTGLSVRKGMQMSVDIWGKRGAKGKVKLVLSLISGVVILVFCSTVMMTVLNLISVQMVSGQLSPAMRIPMYMMSFSIFLGMVLLIITEIDVVNKTCIEELKNEKGASTK